MAMAMAMAMALALAMAKAVATVKTMAMAILFFALLFSVRRHYYHNLARSTCNIVSLIISAAAAAATAAAETAATVFVLGCSLDGPWFSMTSSVGYLSWLHKQ